MQQHMAERKFDFEGEIWQACECTVQTTQARKTELDFQ